MVNKIIVQGRLTKDPEKKEAGGFSFCEFTVAWSDKYKERETKLFLRCKAWRSTADFLEKYFVKGQEIVIEGSLATEEWEKDGQTQSRTVCNVEKINFCGSKGNNAKTENVDDFMKIEDTDKEELPFN